jgi:hypothetical protein
LSFCFQHSVPGLAWTRPSAMNCAHSGNTGRRTNMFRSNRPTPICKFDLWHPYSSTLYWRTNTRWNYLFPLYMMYNNELHLPFKFGEPLGLYSLYLYSCIESIIKFKNYFSTFVSFLSTSCYKKYIPMERGFLQTEEIGVRLIPHPW